VFDNAEHSKTLLVTYTVLQRKPFAFELCFCWHTHKILSQMHGFL